MALDVPSQAQDGLLHVWKVHLKKHLGISDNEVYKKDSFHFLGEASHLAGDPSYHPRFQSSGCATVNIAFLPQNEAPYTATYVNDSLTNFAPFIEDNLVNNNN